MPEKRFIIRYVTEEDKSFLIDMFIRDIEADLDKATRFAHNLIYKVKTLACVNNLGIIGTISWDIRGGLEDGVIEMTALGISPSFQRKGIARELVLTLIDEVKAFFKQFKYKLRVIYLFMEKGNEVGRKFYKKMGFREICTIPSLLPYDDAVFWIKYF